MEGLAPCYTINDSTYRTGNESNVVCNWETNGYRLPTEAEWEKAARGGVHDRRFPWSDTDTISHEQANYKGNGSGNGYDLSDTNGYHPAFATKVYPYTSPVGFFYAGYANGYWLCDMAGNVSEWCWDWFSPIYYHTSPGEDPRGPGSGSLRVCRGGDWYQGAEAARAANRGFSYPSKKAGNIGFRCVRWRTIPDPRAP
jgi:formylglycine-generating enzyme required for sulfatase activity